jgi:tetratricopeptide (TPR) repeat protein
MPGKKVSAKSRILILIIGLLCFVLMAGGLYLFRRERNLAQITRWRAEGLEALSRRDYPTAIDKLTLYLGSKPQDVEALAAYVEARPHVEDPHFQQLTDTVRALRYLLQLDPARQAQRRQLLDLYEQLNMHTEAVDTADTLLEADKNDTHALQIKAQALAEMRKYADALATLDRWLEVEPTNLNAHVARMQMELNNGQEPPQLVADIDAWGKTHPDQTARYELLEAIAVSAEGDTARAQSWLKKAAAQRPPDQAFTEMLIAQMTAIGSGGDEINILQSQIASGGSSEALRDLLLQRLWEMGRNQEASDEALKRQLNQQGSAPVETLALACLACKEAGRHSEAEAISKRIGALPGTEAAAWSAILSPTTGTAQISKLSTACRSALALTPRDPYLRYYYGETLAAMEEDDQALAAWAQAAAEAPGWARPYTRMAEVLFNDGRLDRAMAVAAAAWQRNHDLSTAIIGSQISLALDETGGDMSSPQVQQFIAQVQKAAPDNDQVRLLMAESAALSGHNDDAVKLLQTMIQRQPPPPLSILLRIASFSRIRHLSLEDQVFNVAEKQDPDSPAVAQAQAQQLLAEGRAGEGLSLLRDRIAHRDAAGDDSHWKLIEAQYLDEAHDPSAAATWTALANQFPSDLAVQRSALASPSLRGQRPMLEQIIQRMRTILGPNSLVCDLARARLLVEDRQSDSDDAEVAQILPRMIAAYPGLPEPRVLWAQSLQRAGKPSDAIDQLQLAVEANPQLASLSIALARVYQSRGDRDHASQLLERALRAQVHGPEQVRQAAAMLAEMGETQPALDALAQLKNNAGIDDDLTRAQLDLNRGDLQTAWSIVSPHLQENNAAVLELAAHIAAARGDHDGADRFLQRLDAIPMAAGDKELMHARYDVFIGQHDAAIEQFQKATDAAPDNPAAWRSRITYLFIASHIDEAIRLVDQASHISALASWLGSVKDAVPTLRIALDDEDLRDMARAYLQDPPANAAQLPAMRDAIAAVALADPMAAANQMRALSQKYPGFIGMRLCAIRALLRARLGEEAIAFAQQAVQQFPDSTPLIASNAYCNLALGHWSQALDAAQRWRARPDADHAAADLLTAKALLALKRPSDAEATLKPYFQSPATQPADMDLTVAYAASMQEAGHPGAAGLLLPQADKDDKWRAVCCSFAAEQLSLDEACSWLQKLQPEPGASCNELAALAHAWEVLAARFANDAGASSKAAALYDQIETRPDASAGAMQLAAMFEEQHGQVARALATFRAVVRLDPHRPIALNELAFLIYSTGGDLKEAQQLAQSAVALAPAEPEVIDTLAIIQSKAGEHAEAAAEYQRTVDMDPDNPRWRIDAAQELLAAGNSRQASEFVTALLAPGADLSKLSTPQRQQLESLRAKLPSETFDNAPATQASSR